MKYIAIAPKSKFIINEMEKAIKPNRNRNS